MPYAGALGDFGTFGGFGRRKFGGKTIWLFAIRVV
jgi:hypothetical protein